MDLKMYSKIESYMKECMNDSVHDYQHIYRVLYMSLDIAKEHDIDEDVLVAASLLHDIGRDAEYKDATCNHAIVGADMAFEFLVGLGWNEDRANCVKDCIASHRYRKEHPPKSVEAKILFDADKLDISGGIGIARTLQFGGLISEPLYNVDEDGSILDSGDDSFFNIVNTKLLKLEKRLYTNRAKEICRDRTRLCMEFYQGMLGEVKQLHERGNGLLKDFFKGTD